MPQLQGNSTVSTYVSDASVAAYMSGGWPTWAAAGLHERRLASPHHNGAAAHEESRGRLVGQAQVHQQVQYSRQDGAPTCHQNKAWFISVGYKRVQNVYLDSKLSSLSWLWIQKIDLTPVLYWHLQWRVQEHDRQRKGYDCNLNLNLEIESEVKKVELLKVLTDHSNWDARLGSIDS
jgi:hypothetical protein